MAPTVVPTYEAPKQPRTRVLPTPVLRVVSTPGQQQGDQGLQPGFEEASAGQTQPQSTEPALVPEVVEPMP